MSNATHHDEMNAAAFEEWFSGIMHLLPPDSVIVMDNASYHSETLKKLPNMSWNKLKIQQWLTENGVEYNQKDVKAELLDRIPAHFKMEAKTYKVDKIAEEHGHTVLRLPPYHCDLNPIELVWAQVKNAVAMTNTDYNMSSVEEDLHKAINNVTAENWKKCVEHVKKIEAYMWDLDGISDEVQDRIVVMDAGNSDDTEEESWSSDEVSDGESNDELAVPL